MCAQLQAGGFNKCNHIISKTLCCFTVDPVVCIFTDGVCRWIFVCGKLISAGLSMCVEFKSYCRYGYSNW